MLNECEFTDSIGLAITAEEIQDAASRTRSGRDTRRDSRSRGVASGVAGFPGQARGGSAQKFCSTGHPAGALDRGAPPDDGGDRDGPSVGRMPESAQASVHSARSSGRAETNIAAWAFASGVGSAKPAVSSARTDLSLLNLLFAAPRPFGRGPLDPSGQPAGAHNVER